MSDSTQDDKGIEESVRYAQKYLEDILSFFGLNIEVYATREDDVIELSVPSTRMNGFLIGQHGDTMRSLQFVVSSALKNHNYQLDRVNVDIAGYKKHRQDRLAEKTEGWIDEIVKAGKARSLRPMNAADRRIVHKVVGDDPRVESHSEGEGRDRHVVVAPSSSKSGESVESKEK